MLLHFLQSSNESRSSSQKQREYDHPDIVATDLEARIAESCKMVSTSYGIFKSKAAEQVGGDQLILFFPECSVLLA